MNSEEGQVEEVDNYCKLEKDSIIEATNNEKESLIATTNEMTYPW